MSIKNRLKHLLGRYPSIFFPAYRLTAPEHHIRECLMSQEKELVIEGFPRSANTFAVVAFRQAQGRYVPMGHHLHVEAQILQGVKWGKPVIVLLRNLVDAVKSLLIRHPSVKWEHAFCRYVHFYSAVLKVRDRVIIDHFNEVTNNFGDVIKKMNARFGCDYRPFEHTKGNVAKVFEEIEAINLQLDQGEESHVARPSRERENIKRAIRIDEKAPIVRRALEIYEALREER